MLPSWEQEEISQIGRYCNDMESEATTMSASATGRHHADKTLHPDVQNSTVHHEDHDTVSFSKAQQILAQELAFQVKVQKDGTCPIEWMFLSLLDSHKKNSNSRPPGS
jgi:hypothetical protein